MVKASRIPIEVCVNAPALIIMPHALLFALCISSIISPSKLD